ncbi:MULTISPECIES: DNA recombination protein RmuC [unclassified Rathayibacter]|uniref:DNA recombination protein RmuC n=1 Tax=unclassified Rathayibacter TaxID=2609250 RepID=UPI00104697AD|nr:MULTISPECIES: DNA recombination protein RmuC [unclassified Rathayibacter]MCJ1704895.1 DNA recombination protein RmuC [Rathayibacter sp. VKM Ac-2926]TCL84488.1 DNA recombination protein RmuC [Rathayibacter sp. PhB192]TCM30206.1 DNA recombination protein RmuC [Rathayibacter sp. PhB179]
MELSFVLGLAVGALLAAVVAVLLARARTPDTALALELATAQARAEGLEERHESVVEQHREHLGSARDQIRELQEQLRVVAERERHDARILQTLSPVAESLRGMQESVRRLESERAAQFGAITEQLEGQRLAGERLRSTTETLASALRSSASRGAWGETQLRNVVEAAGLTQRVDFDVQFGLEGEGGKGRADMVVRLPGGKAIAVDAKVPFDAYLEASAIPAGAGAEEEARRAGLLRAHVRALRGHIDALAGRAYWTGLPASPEFVIAFIPSEPLLASALDADPTLLEYAFRKRVALASPVTLWSVLKTVAYTWQQDVLTDDAKRLLDLGKTLYARLATLADHAEGLRRSIEKTVDSYNAFAGSLETRVLVTARQFDTLDESRVIAPAGGVTVSPRRLTAVELLAPDERTA